MSDVPTPAGGWVPACLVAAFGDNGDVYCRKCVEADRELQKRLELPSEDEFSLAIIADDDDESAPVLSMPLSQVQGIRCMNCEVQIPEFPAHLRASTKGLTHGR